MRTGGNELNTPINSTSDRISKPISKDYAQMIAKSGSIRSYILHKNQDEI